ncbi:hypothetical protein ACP6PL_04720 [Dapis sp. BLCC M126]|uniref:hypothetical protein n=1 Tax=Dapis sp. BLCC M126 TaxID=3400189 RepID=UPI003CF75111
MFELPGYRLLNLIENNSKTQVYHGIGQQDAQKAIIKILTVEYPSASDLLRYQQEYTIARNTK